MDSVQVHLALTHVPVILSLIGLVMLAIAFLIKNSTVTRTSYILLVLAGIAAIPVFFTGEGAEDAIENLPGVSESVIETHEDVAALAMITISITAFVTLAALIALRWKIASRLFSIAVLLTAVVSVALMIQTAHLGGQIRHSEIRGDAALHDFSGSRQPGNDRE